LWRDHSARAQGVDISADTTLILHVQRLSAFIPAWAHDGGNAKLIERLKDPAMRERIRKDMLTPSDQWDNEWQEIPGPKPSSSASCTSTIASLQGKTLAEIARTGTRIQWTLSSTC